VEVVFERFTDRAREALVFAQEEARLLNHSFIGTEHLLLGVLHLEDTLGAKALESLGIRLSAAREKVEEIIGMSGASPSASPPFTPRSKRALELTLREAMQLAHSQIGTEHIILGLVREGNGVASTVMIDLGADLPLVRQTVIQLISEHPENYPDPSNRSVEARCPRCQVSLAQGARFSTIDVFTDQPNSTEAISIDVVYCSQCGTTLHVVGSDLATSLPRLHDGFTDQNITAQVRLSPFLEGTQGTNETGPPPEYEFSAQAAIAKAFANMGEIDEVNGTVPSVEDSEGLAVCREQATELARQRFGGQVPNVTVTFTVDSISFINDHEAQVTYTAQVTGSLNITLGGRLGRAILVNGIWKVGRETFCEWMLTGGVHCPPRKNR
jgi:hypothetical protein